MESEEAVLSTDQSSPQPALPVKEQLEPEPKTQSEPLAVSSAEVANAPQAAPLNFEQGLAPNVTGSPADISGDGFNIRNYCDTRDYYDQPTCQLFAFETCIWSEDNPRIPSTDYPHTRECDDPVVSQRLVREFVNSEVGPDALTAPAVPLNGMARGSDGSIRPLNTLNNLRQRTYGSSTRGNGLSEHDELYASPGPTRRKRSRDAHDQDSPDAGRRVLPKGAGILDKAGAAKQALLSPGSSTSPRRRAVSTGVPGFGNASLKNMDKMIRPGKTTRLSDRESDFGPPNAFAVPSLPSSPDELAIPANVKPRVDQKRKRVAEDAADLNSARPHEEQASKRPRIGEAETLKPPKTAVGSPHIEPHVATPATANGAQSSKDSSADVTTGDATIQSSTNEPQTAHGEIVGQEEATSTPTTSISTESANQVTQEQVPPIEHWVKVKTEDVDDFTEIPQPSTFQKQPSPMHAAAPGNRFPTKPPAKKQAFVPHSLTFKVTTIASQGTTLHSTGNRNMPFEIITSKDSASSAVKIEFRPQGQWKTLFTFKDIEHMAYAEAGSMVQFLSRVLPRKARQWWYLDFKDVPEQQRFTYSMLNEYSIQCDLKVKSPAVIDNEYKVARSSRGAAPLKAGAKSSGRVPAQGNAQVKDVNGSRGQQSRAQIGHVESSQSQQNRVETIHAEDSQSQQSNAHNEIVCIPDDSDSPARRTTRNSQQAQQSATVAPPPPARRGSPMIPLERFKEWDTPLVFPAKSRARATVDFSDLKRLNEKEKLNDNLIYFSLRYAQVKHAQSSARVYIFNSFFFENLCKNVPKGKKINFENVKRWTARVNLFKDYDYIVVPINEQDHWYAAIICNTTRITEPCESAVIASSVGESQGTDAKGKAPLPTALSAKDTLALNNGEVLEVPSSDPPDSSSTTQPTEEREPRKPVIIMLDSLQMVHPAVVAKLKDWLDEEAWAKNRVCTDMPKASNEKNLPLQTNSIDCGVFLIGYICKFLADPEGFVAKQALRTLGKDPDWDRMEPLVMRKNIRSIMLNEWDAMMADRGEFAGLSADQIRQHRVCPPMLSTAFEEIIYAKDDAVEPSVGSCSSARGQDLPPATSSSSPGVSASPHSVARSADATQMSSSPLPSSSPAGVFRTDGGIVPAPSPSSQDQMGIGRSVPEVLGPLPGVGAWIANTADGNRAGQQSASMTTGRPPFRAPSLPPWDYRRPDSPGGASPSQLQPSSQSSSEGTARLSSVDGSWGSSPYPGAKRRLDSDEEGDDLAGAPKRPRTSAESSGRGSQEAMSRADDLLRALDGGAAAERSPWSGGEGGEALPSIKQEPGLSPPRRLTRSSAQAHNGHSAIVGLEDAMGMAGGEAPQPFGKP